MTFGLRNAAQSFQRLMDNTLRGLDFCHGYIDDLLVASKNAEEHLSHLRQVFQRLREYNLTINAFKCALGKVEVEYLGHHINKDGIKPLPGRVQAVLEYPKPQNIAQLRKFLGILKFYRQFFRDAARIQAPLHAYLMGARKKDKRPIIWNNESDYAFEQCKKSLSRCYSFGSSERRCTTFIIYRRIGFSHGCRTSTGPSGFLGTFRFLFS